jgi:hypothetical protein
LRCHKILPYKPDPQPQYSWKMVGPDWTTLLWSVCACSKLLFFRRIPRLICLWGPKADSGRRRATRFLWIRLTQTLAA